MYILLLALSAIPNIDMYITKKIANITKTKLYTYYYSHIIIYFNLYVNMYITYYNHNYKLLLIRYIIELVVVNILLKFLFDRSRPKDSFLINNNYTSLFYLKLTINHKENQSFPSGHVTTVYTTYYLLNFYNWYLWSNIYFCLIIVTIFSRINLGAHYLSDCMFAILISNIFFSIFIY